MPAPAGQRCRYVHSGDGGHVDLGGEGGLPATAEGGWRCPHYRLTPSDGSEERDEHCPFHRGTGDDGAAVSLAAYLRIALGMDVALPTELAAYARRVEEAGTLSPRERTCAVGATFAGADIDYTVLDSGSNVPIDLREATFEGPVSMRSATVEQPVWLDGTEFQGSVTVTEARFVRRFRCNGARFRANLSASQVDFDAWAEFSGVVVTGEANFRGATLRDGIFATDARFEGPVDFMNATFLDVANFTRATFERGALFSSTDFDGGMFRETTFSGPVGVCESLVDGTDINSRWQNLSVTDRGVVGSAVVIRNATCEGNLRFENATVDNSVSVVASRISGQLFFDGLQTVDGTPQFDFTETGVVAGSFETAEPAEFDFTDATIGDIETIRPSPALIRFQRSDFQGLDFGKHRDLFDSMGWDLCRNASMEATERENVFLRAKNGATQMGENTAASRFHYREAEQRGRSYRQRLPEAVQARDPGRVGSLLRRWIGNRFLKYSCGYGEKPGRVFLSSVGIILLYAIAYALIDVPTTYRGFFAPFVLSFDSFGAIILGLPSVNNSSIGLLVASEAFLGPFFVALFVFNLTQSINR